MSFARATLLSFGLIALISSFANAQYEQDWLEVDEDTAPPAESKTAASVPSPVSPPPTSPVPPNKGEKTNEARPIKSLTKRASGAYKGFKKMMFGGKKKAPKNADETKSPPARWMNAMKTCEGEVENQIKKKSSMTDKDIKEAMSQCLKKREAFSMSGMLSGAKKAIGNGFSGAKKAIGNSFSGAKKAVGDAYDRSKKAADKTGEKVSKSAAVKPATDSKLPPALSFEAYDVNNDGGIDYEEFMAIQEGDQGGCGQFGYWSCDTATSGGSPICKWCGNMVSGTCRSKQNYQC